VLEITIGCTPIGVSNTYTGASYRKIPIGCTIGPLDPYRFTPIVNLPIGHAPIVILPIGKNTIGVRNPYRSSYRALH
jgi:hypothetical protein